MRPVSRLVVPDSTNVHVASGSDQRTVRVLIIEDQALIRAGLRKLVESFAGFQVVAEIGSHADRQTLGMAPELAVVDLDAGDEDDLDVVRRLRECHPGIRILVLTNTDDSALHYRAMEAGAMGIVPKKASADVFESAIERVATGGVWFSRAMTERFLSDRRSEDTPKQVSGPASKLTSLSKREREIVDVACEGLRNEEIAKRLFISPVTVRHHLTAIFAKLGVSNRHGLIAYAYRQGRLAKAS